MKRYRVTVDLTARELQALRAVLELPFVGDDDDLVGVVGEGSLRAARSMHRKVTASLAAARGAHAEVTPAMQEARRRIVEESGATFSRAEIDAVIATLRAGRRRR